MPGSGKSFVGRALADTLGLEIVDFDREMEKQYGRSLQALVDEWGDTLFIEREGDFAIGATKGRDNIVISPGGSIVYNLKAMKHVRDVSFVAYLEAPLSLIEERIGTMPRGIIGIKEKMLADLYAERTLLYKQYAHETFNADQDAAQVAEQIIRQM